MRAEPLTMVVGNYGVTAALKSETREIAQRPLRQIEIEPVTAAMRRMVRGLEFDICEMAITTYLCARAYGKPITAIPVFVTRNFHHWAAFTTERSGIGHPKDLEGRRVAVNRGYTVTTGVWIRGILASEYGVDLERITWVPTDDEHVAEFRYPGNVDLSCRGQSAAGLLLAGDCAAAIGDVRDASPLLRPLLPDARQAGFDYFRRTGIYPVNHTIAIRDEVLAAHPGLARELFDGLVRAKAAYYARLDGGIAVSTSDAGPAEIRRVLGIEPFPYGLAANRPALEAISAFAVAQRVLDQSQPLTELFAAVG